MVDKFSPDTRLMCSCSECRYFNPQRSLLSEIISGRCENIYKRKVDRCVEHFTIIDAKSTTCGYSVSDDSKDFNESAYFKRDNTDREYEFKRISRGITNEQR